MSNPAGSVPASLAFLLMLIPLAGAIILLSVAWKAPFAVSILISLGAGTALIFSLKLRRPAGGSRGRRSGRDAG